MLLSLCNFSSTSLTAYLICFLNSHVCLLCFFLLSITVADFRESVQEEKIQKKNDYRIQVDFEQAKNY